MKAKQFKLEDQVILQLGCVGSQSKISYGTKVPINLCGTQDQIYLNLVNIDRYNCIIGTPFINTYGVCLDFGKHTIHMNRQEINVLSFEEEQQYVDKKKLGRSWGPRPPPREMAPIPIRRISPPNPPTSAWLGTVGSTRVEPALSHFEIAGDVLNDKTVPTLSPNNRKAVKKLIKKPTIGFWASRNISESKRLTQKNICAIGRPWVNTQSLVSSKDPYVPSNIPELQEQWFDRNSDLLSPIPLKLPPFREINHRISLIDDEVRHNYYMPWCPEALQEELWEKITWYVTARWWEIKPIYQATPLLCVPKKNGKLQNSSWCAEKEWQYL